MILTDKVTIQTVGATYLTMAAIAFVPQALNMVDFGAIRAAGFKNFPLITTIVGMWGVRVLISAVAVWVLHADIKLVFFGIALDQIVRWLISLIYIKRKRIYG